MLNTKSSLNGSGSYFQSAQNIFTAYPRITSSSENFYLSTEGSTFPSNPSFLPFVSRPDAHVFPTALVGGGMGNDVGNDSWRGLPTGPAAAAGCWPYDSLHSFHYAPSYGGLDVRRKNATRESTSTLKAWLYEHIKNPYPTKGEKIMLAIITKMTLTQVSTWFANARRRLKKENKMQWSPRNRTGDDDDDDDDDDKNSDVMDDRQDNEAMRRRNNVGDDEDDDDDDEIVVDTDQPTFIPFPINITASSYPQIFENKPPATANPHPPTSNISEAAKPNSPNKAKDKPRIWSLVDVATSGLELKSGSEDSRPAVIKSTLQALTEEEEEEVHRQLRSRNHPQPHRTSNASPSSQPPPLKQVPISDALSPLHKLHSIAGNHLSHLQSLYFNHLAGSRSNFSNSNHKGDPSPRHSEDSARSSANKNFDSRQFLYQNGTAIAIPPQIR